MSIPSGFRELREAIGFAAANGPWFEKVEGSRLIRAFRPGPQHANALGIVHGGMLAAFLDSAMGSTVSHALQRRFILGIHRKRRAIAVQRCLQLTIP